MAPVRLKNASDQARAAGVTSSKKLVSTRSPWATGSPTAWMSTFWNDIGITVMPWSARLNSAACFMAVALPAAAFNASTLAPDAWACSRRS